MKPKPKPSKVTPCPQPHREPTNDDMLLRLVVAAERCAAALEGQLELSRELVEPAKKILAGLK